MRSRPRSITPAAPPMWAPWSTTSPSASASSAWPWSATPWAAIWCSSSPASGARGRRLSPSPPSARPSIWPPAPMLCTSRPTASTSGDFLRGLMRRLRRKAALFPAIYQLRGIGPIRSIREFDQKIVARYCGFRDADDYYYRAASARVVDRIAVPTLILCAQDDPFIRLSPETRARILANPHIAFVETPPRRPLRLPGAPFRRRRPLGRGHRRPLPSGCRCRYAAPPPRRANRSLRSYNKYRGRVAQSDRAPAF